MIRGFATININEIQNIIMPTTEIISSITLNSYADLIAFGTPTKTTIVTVLNDEDKGLENTEYRLYNNGVRMWIANTQDN